MFLMNCLKSGRKRPVVNFEKFLINQKLFTEEKLKIQRINKRKLY